MKMGTSTVGKAIGSEVRYDKIKWNLKDDGTKRYYARFIKELVVCYVDEHRLGINDGGPATSWRASVEWFSKKEIVGTYDDLETAKRACVDYFVKWVESYSENIVRLKGEDLKWGGVDDVVGSRLDKTKYSANIGDGCFVLLVDVNVRCDFVGRGNQHMYTVKMNSCIQGCRKNYLLGEVVEIFNPMSGGAISFGSSFTDFYVDIIDKAKKNVLNNLKRIVIANRERISKMIFEMGMEKVEIKREESIHSDCGRPLPSDYEIVNKDVETMKRLADQLELDFDEMPDGPVVFEVKDKDGAYKVVVDWDDLDKIKSYKWYVKTEKSGQKVVRTYVKGESGAIYLHRLIMGLGIGDNKYVLHKNGNGMDNRKANLMIKGDNKNGGCDDVTAIYTKDDLQLKIDFSDVKKVLDDLTKNYKGDDAEIGGGIDLDSLKKKATEVRETWDKMRGDIKILVDDSTGEQAGIMVNGKFISIDKLRNLA